MVHADGAGARPVARRHQADAGDDAAPDQAGGFAGCFGGPLLVEIVARPFGQAAVVGEDERRLVRADQVEHLRDDRRPDRVAGQVAEVIDDRHDLQIERLFVGGVDDGDRAGMQVRGWELRVVGVGEMLIRNLDSGTGCSIR